MVPSPLSAPTLLPLPLVGYLEIDEVGRPHLVGTICQDCGAISFRETLACPRCGDRELQPWRAGDTGTVRSFTVVHRGPPGIKTPYTSTVVALDGGGTVKTNLVDIPPEPEAIAVGMRVRLTTITAGTTQSGQEVVAPAFRPDTAEEGPR